MADHTKIEWTDATWNPIVGCQVVSAGCKNCYAMKLAGGRMRNHPTRAGLTQDTKAGPVWNGQVRLNMAEMFKPQSWTRPRRIFVCAHADLFYEAVPEAWIDQVFAIMALSPQHTFQVLTKRPERMRNYVSSADTVRRVYDLVCDLVVDQVAKVVLIAPGTDPAAAPQGTRVHLDAWPLPNVWKGVSVEDQSAADERIPFLLDTLAAIRWISAEPLLGPLNIEPWTCRHCMGRRWVDDEGWSPPYPEFGWVERAPREGLIPCASCNLGGWDVEVAPCRPCLDWAVVGGESGSAARPMQAEWARDLRDQCVATSTPFLFKQWGEFRPTSDARGPYMMRVGKKAAGRQLDGVTWDQYPGVLG